ncbi:MAG TPA: GNAT family N-acetyltransferase [Ilumatobacter sp.]|nr:GNAT family N-acetyltransferase [Ilumatobacter sp.]
MTIIRRATEADIGTVARTYGRAFADDPVMRWLIPDDDEYEAIQVPFFGALARRWLFHGTLWCTDDGVAVAGWNPPGRPGAVVVDPTPVHHPDWRIERFIALRTVIDANTPPETHWHLNMIATHPDWQRRGLAGALMSTVFEVADEAGLPCYLETETPENVAYYRHHGFEVRTEWDAATADSQGPHMWGMLRPSRDQVRERVTGFRDERAPVAEDRRHRVQHPPGA